MIRRVVRAGLGIAEACFLRASLDCRSRSVSLILLCISESATAGAPSRTPAVSRNPEKRQAEFMLRFVISARKPLFMPNSAHKIMCTRALFLIPGQSYHLAFFRSSVHVESG